MVASLIYKISDYILLNAYSLNSSGFYNGKAGISLALFEVARLMDSDYLEEHAFELLQEALLYKGKDLGFSNGYSGISFVLHYLIDNEFIETDIDELFGVQEQNLKPDVDILTSLADIPTAALSICIDRLYLLRREYERNIAEIEQLESFIFSSSEEELETKLLEIMGSKGLSIGYTDGLARWLLYVVYIKSLENGLDVSRFDSLFKLMPLWRR